MEVSIQPKNNLVPRVFVAATRQNDGKTTSCLGLYAALQFHFERVGYIKPIGQRFVELEGRMVDEDSILFDRTFQVASPIESMSPIAIDGTFTRRFLDHPEARYRVLLKILTDAFDRAAYEKDLIIIEGSGHAGVGAICDLSNAHVAAHLRSPVIIVAKGGIGKPVDEIALNKSLFDKHHVPVIGAILNKVEESKIEMVSNYTRKGLERLGVPLLGCIPKIAPLGFPNLSQVVETVEARWLNGRNSGSLNRINQVVVGAMTPRSLFDYIRPGILIITPGDREDILLLAIAATRTRQNQIGGIVLTRNILPSPHMMELIAQTSIPVVISKEESYTVASRINSMTVKTLPEDQDKIPLIKELVLKHVDIEAILQKLGPI